MSRYIYEKHKGLIPKNHVICHSCDNPKCINPQHLLTGTQKQNIQDAVKKGRMARGEKQHLSKLTEEQVREILKSDKSGVELGKQFGITKGNVNCIKRRETWKHVEVRT